MPKITRIDDLPLETQIRVTAANTELAELDEALRVLRAKRGKIIERLNMKFVVATVCGRKTMFFTGRRVTSSINTAYVYDNPSEARAELPFVNETLSSREETFSVFTLE